METKEQLKPRLTQRETPNDLCPDVHPRLRCSVGVMAYNEAENVALVLHDPCQQNQEHSEIKDILVVASGCTDGTEDIVRREQETDSRVRLIAEPVRSGKASAINTFLAATSEDTDHHPDHLSTGSGLFHRHSSHRYLGLHHDRSQI